MTMGLHEKKIEDLTIGIVGLGLMGGAIAAALKNCGAASAGRILGCDSDGETLSMALAAGAIDEGFTVNAEAVQNTPETWHVSEMRGVSEMLKLCDLVFLCLNPSTLLAFMASHMKDFREGAVITDIAGTKAAICAEMEKNLRPDLDFIPAHPMAGGEKGGFVNAGLCNFKGKNYILTPLKRNRPENLEYIQNLVRRMGFGRITITTAEDHDRKIAFTSQLCHLIAAALIDCEGSLFPDDREITRFGGGSFEDLTRIAMLNAPMWTEIFLQNSGELLKCLGQFEASLDKLRSYIEQKDSGALSQNLYRVRERRIAMQAK